MFYLHKINLYFIVDVNQCQRKPMSTLTNVDVIQRPLIYLIFIIYLLYIRIIRFISTKNIL